jgi:hypothetical protein
MTYTSGGLGFAYIAQSLQHEPLDQTNLRNGVDVTQESVGNRHSNWETDEGAHRPTGPTCHPLGGCFGGEPPRVFQNLPT